MNSPVIKFIAKALLIFIIWYLIYELWLLPDGSLDEWLSLNIIGASAGFLKWIGYEVFTVNRIIGIGEYPGIEIVDGCNGIAAMGLFLGFILAYPGDWKNRISFSVLGICVIYVVNMVRIITLTITQVEWPKFFDFTHDYSTTTIFYLVIFLLWMVWVNYSDMNSFSNPSKAMT
ncbi:MAG: archaeosortase/exosortase family protein [Gracilimonas sp.]